MPSDLPQRQSPLRALVEERMGEPVEEYVRGLREQGEGWDRIALAIFARTGTTLSGQTLRGWFGDRDWAPRSRRPKRDAANAA